MDKLKEVLKYQFWILLGVALILPFVGWIMGTSGMMSEAAERTKKLTDLRSSLKVEAADPNDTWSNDLAQINVEQEKQHEIAWRKLYEIQKPKMIWPEVMTKDTDWPADNDPEKMNNRHLELYRMLYRAKRGGEPLVETVRKIVKPIVDDDPQTGLVVLDPSLMPAPDEDWLNYAPTIKQVKAAQEDLWLLAAILECIAKVNEGAPNAYDAPIREIDEILLRGGTKGAGASASKSSVGSPTGPSTTGTMAESMMKGMPSMMGPGMRGGDFGGGGGGALDFKINPDEDLGPERPSADSKSATASTSGPSSPTGGTTGTMADMMKGMPSMMGPGGMGGLGGRQSGGTNMERYRDEQKEFKTRGFSLQVVMDHRRIPDLLVALANCEHWPINVLRVHEADYKDEDLVMGEGESSSTGRMSGPSAMSGRRGGAMTPGMLGGMAEMMRGAPRSGGLPTPKSSGFRNADEGGEGYSSSRSPLDDPNLANVAIVGLIYIFNKPPDAPPAPASAQPAAATQPVAGTIPATETPAAASETSETAADTAEKTESASADEDKPDDSTDDKPETPPASDAQPGKSD